MRGQRREGRTPPLSSLSGGPRRAVYRYFTHKYCGIPNILAGQVRKALALAIRRRSRRSRAMLDVSTNLTDGPGQWATVCRTRDVAAVQRARTEISQPHFQSGDECRRVEVQPTTTCDLQT